MSMWDQAEEMAEKAANQGGIFLRLQDDGDKAVVAFCGDPHPHEVVWTGEGYEKYDPAKHTDKKPSLRIKLNVWDLADNAMKIWEISSNVFKSVVKLRKKYGLDAKTFEITRNGRKGDTKTTYMILPEGEIDKALTERLSMEDLHDLTTDGSGNGARTEAASGGNPEILMRILKSLPKDGLTYFLETMEIKKVKDLPESKMITALALANELKKPKTTDADADPFA